MMSNMSSISGLSGLSSFSSPPPPEVFAKDFRDTEVYADLNFMSEPSPLTGSSVETTSTIFSDSSSDSEKAKLVSIENLLAAERTSCVYSIPGGQRGARGRDPGSNDLNDDLTLRQNELEDTNTLPRLSCSRDRLNISPELDDVDGCGMIVDSEAVRFVGAEVMVGAAANPNIATDNVTKTRLGSTNSSHSYTSGGSTSSVSLSAGLCSSSSGSGSSASGSSQPHLPLVTSSSSNDLDVFLSTVQRNVDALSPKLPKCEPHNHSKVAGVLGNNSGGDGELASGSCVFESHGQVKEPDPESMDLLDEVLRACSVDAFSSSSGGHSSHGSKGDLGVHSIHSSTCSIGSANQGGDGTGLSDSGSAQTSPAMAGSLRTSPARNSPIHPGHSPPLPPAPPPPLTASSQEESAAAQSGLCLNNPLPCGIQISSAKCHNHHYVNVSGINSSNLLGGHTSNQQPRPILSTFCPVPSKAPNNSKQSNIQQGPTANNAIRSQQMNNYHDYVNVSALNGNGATEAPPAPSMQQQQQQQHHPVQTSSAYPDANSNPSVPVMLSNKVLVSPNQPLPYVDLGCYDNDEAGYLYWVKGAAESTKAPVILTQPTVKQAVIVTCTDQDQSNLKATEARDTQGRGDGGGDGRGKEDGTFYIRADNKSQPNLNQYEHDHQEYVNTPVSGARSVMAKLSAVRGKLLAYHDSLRRSKKTPLRRNTVGDSSPKPSTSAKSSPKASPKHSPKSSPKRSPRSSPKSDRNSLRTELFRSRGKSLEDILYATVGAPKGQQGQVVAGSQPQPDLFGLPPPAPRAPRLTPSSRLDGEYVQLNLDDSDKSVMHGNRERWAVPEVSRTPASEETTYIMMAGEGQTRPNTSAAYAYNDADSSSLQAGYDAHCAAGAAGGGPTNPFARSPSPIRSPRSLRRTPPSVGAMSPHTSPKKVRGQPPVAEHGNYMFMSGQLNEEDDRAVFCAMELPLRSGSVSSHHSLRSRNCSFSSTASTDTHYADDTSYLSMAMGRQRSNSSQVFRPVNRPPLNQSRSLDTDYEVEYLPMNMVPGGAARSHQHGNYMCMTPPGDEGASAAPVRPFEDLIEHEPYVTKKPMIPPSASRKNSDASVSGKGDDYVKSPPTGKRDRFLSRLIRRNSSKERKSNQSKSQEDILRSPIAEALPEVPISEPNTPSPYNTRVVQDPFGLCPSPRTRRASEDVTAMPPYTVRGRSASYSYNRTGWSDAANLTDEQKQQSVLSVASSSSSQHHSPRSDSPPALPPRTYIKTAKEPPFHLKLIPRKKPTPPPPPDDSPQSSNSPDLDFLDRPISPNMPTEPAPPPPMYLHGSETTLSCTDSNPNSTNTSTLTLLHISEEDSINRTPPPELPEKTHRRRSSPGSVLSASLGILRRQTSRRCPSPTWHSQSELLLTEEGKAASACASPLTTPRVGGGGQRSNRLMVHIPPNAEDDEEMWGSHSNSGSRGKRL